MADEQNFDGLSDGQQSTLLQIAEIGKERSALVTEREKLHAQRAIIRARELAISTRLGELEHIHNELSHAYRLRTFIDSEAQVRAERGARLRELRQFAKAEIWEEGGETK